MEKKARLILAHLDHLSGEVTGFAVGKIMELGANNVHLIPTTTKKNRPGNIIIIDRDAGIEEKIAGFLAKELKISGYHRIDTTHFFQRVSFCEKSINFERDGKRKSIPCKVKVIGDPSEPLATAIEHDFLVEVQEMLKEVFDSFFSLSELRATIESRLKESGDEITLKM